MQKVAEVEDPEDGPVWRWQITRNEFEQKNTPMKYPIRIETDRLYSRPLTLEDHTEWQRFFESAEATRHFPAAPGTPLERAKDWMEKQLGRYADGKYGMMALIHKETGTWIGQCGLLAQNVDNADELEVGYHIFPEHWLQGYATEAARAFRDLGFRNTTTPSIISIIHRDNMGSQAVARNNGMTREKACEFRNMPVYVYRIWREEWENILH
jgi:RimJ/RimL family protein N-acetyltransferase